MDKMSASQHWDRGLSIGDKLNMSCPVLQLN